MRTYHGVHSSPVASLDEKSDICVHERDCHCDVGSVRKDKGGVLTEAFDDREDVVPATTVQTRRMVAQLVDDLVGMSVS